MTPTMKVVFTTGVNFTRRQRLDRTLVQFLRNHNHREAPTESVAMSKQGLTVMYSKCPAT